jgi:D-serine dehydratase
MAAAATTSGWGDARARVQLQRVPPYLARVRALQEETAALAERSSKLAKKAIRMQRKRQEDEVQEEVERRKFLDQDRALAAKVADP